ncbi:hypothetical protein L249_0033 [Ophiocordyceps polyrhachis-furcata BCC 54312]|uniref:Transcriptional regulator n=1 Tax=Ophiocordyceps polyrhachis-furcata BCC 54312 TaxID=1330021 RepID=A0A367LEV4_9HYPO|nr:hypothetical protein L249_0033 [Ophiocordyceps polyrhachis-furcata BCC 54312]
MPPSAKELERALIDATCHIYKTDPDAISVNSVRRHVEQKFALEADFFASSEWKSRSKTLIKEYVDKLLDGWTPKTQGRLKRPSSEPSSPPIKRQKRASQPKSGKREKSSEPRPKPRTKKNATRPKSETSTTDDDAEPPTSPRLEKENRKTVKDESEDDAINHGDLDHGKEPERPTKSRPDADEEKVQEDGDARDTSTGEEVKPAVDEEEEYSDVIDEVPNPKARRKNGKDAPKPSKPAPKKVSTDDGPEAEIKKLQSQLVKCGIRKLWHNELKQYGTDTRAKVRHLKKMLAEIGMDGRFSEAKAREIKETRELMAEAEAAQQMNQLWGLSSTGRASRSKSKSTKVEESEVVAADGESEDDDDGGGNSFAARRRRAQADLAFLGDDSDSE